MLFHNIGFLSFNNQLKGKHFIVHLFTAVLWIYDIVWAHFTMQSPNAYTATKVRNLVRIHHALTMTR